MAEILHQLIVWLPQYLQEFINPRWCRISEPSTVSPPVSDDLLHPKNGKVQGNKYDYIMTAYQGGHPEAKPIQPRHSI